MEESKKIINTGLRAITVASTRIRSVDGEAGKLIYRGYPIFDLSDKTSYEEIVHLLLYESLPDKQQLNDLKKKVSIFIRMSIFTVRPWTITWGFPQTFSRRYLLFQGLPGGLPM